MRHPAGLVLFPGLPTARERAEQARGKRVAEREVQAGETAAGASGEAPVAVQGGGRARGARYLVLHLPGFSLERCGYGADEVAACVDEVKSATRITALTPAARAEGLRIGMTAAEARAQCPDVLLETHDPLGERVDRQALLEAFAGFSDRLAEWAAQDLVLDVRGTAHLFGGEGGLVSKVRERAALLGHACRIAVADDPLAAWAVAAFCPQEDVVVPRGESAQALAPLPIAALVPSAELSASLEALGIRRIETWARLDPASVSGRFGPEGVRLHRIARGLVASRLPWQLPDGGTLVEGVVLGGPTIRLDPIHFVLPGLLARLTEALARQDAMAVRLAVRLLLERGPAHVVRVRVGRPTRDAERLKKLIVARLERIRLDAPALELLLEVEEHTAEQAWQPGLLDRAEAVEELPDLLARMSDALGEQALVGPVSVDTFLPEEAWRGRAFQPGAPLPGPPVHRKAADDPVAEQRAAETEVLPPRPTRLLSQPERVEVQARGGRPHRIRLQGAWRRVETCEGPERIEGGWWRADGGWCRDYWVVGTELGVGWCFLDVTGAWRWHGWFD